ncbi:MAG TPA: hypothetical protein VMB82_04640 [Acidimicrobiales bacterium]|nr:hypothetical protein [Acidimicrobiales bacterium]
MHDGLLLAPLQALSTWISPTVVPSAEHRRPVTPAAIAQVGC